MGTASGVVFFRPWALQTGARFKASVGISAYENTGTIYGDIILDDHRVGVTAALGVAYDFRISPSMSVSPAFSVGSTTFFGEARKTWQLGVGLTWH
jgi:hypothetical protein